MGPTSATEPEFRPFVPAEVSMRELTVRAVILGSVLGIVFAASSVYLGLKVGLTVSASIPIAVLSITLFKWLTRAFGLRGGTILENNVVQTTGSAGESIAAGVAFTLPSLLLMGFEMELGRILLVAVLGGLIGVLMMIPLRHGLMVKEHGKLTFPEGTACAGVLIVGEKGGTSASTVFLGFFVGLGYQVLNLVLKLWSDAAIFALTFWDKLKGAMLAFEVSPPMLGVGYVIGLRTASNMMAGGALAFLVLVPMIHHFGDASTEPMYPADKLISQMSPGEIRNNFILYIGAGAVATGGFIALARSLPSIAGAFKRGLGTLAASRAGGGGAAVPRTERDLSMRVVLGGSLALAVAITVAPILDINLLSAGLIVLFGFFFVTVSARITGEIGSSSNPISGMTVATLLITCGLFVALGWTGTDYKALALTTAALVCVAASNGGTIAQDLKTGHLVGGTPRAQQIAILCGVVTSAMVIGWTLQMLNENSSTLKPVQGPAIAEATASGQRMTGADGVEYDVVYLREEQAGLARGKYLVDAAGAPTFLVDPGVCGTYPYSAVAAAGEAVAVPPDAPRELGPDHLEYARVEQGTRTLLVRADGTPAWELERRAKFDAPKAQLFRLIIDGTLGGDLPIALVLIGMMLALLVELIGVASLPFAVGLYLPIATSAAIVGGIVRWLVERKRGAGADAEFAPGTLMASGLIAGGAIGGIVATVVEASHPGGPWVLRDLTHGLGESWWPMLPFLLMAALLYKVGAKRKPAG
jgi:putative OPT family oligopeptide transporter